MQDLIDRKSGELKGLGLINLEFRKWLDRSNITNWVYSQLRVSGEPVSRQNVSDILEGKLIGDAPVELYGFVQGYGDVYSDMKSAVFMGQNPDLRSLARWGKVLFKEDLSFRKGEVAVYEWNHISSLSENIERDTDILLRRMSKEKKGLTPLKKAGARHMEFCRLYPYGAKTPVMAGLLLAYDLLFAGYPLPVLTVGDIEYNKLIGAGLSGEETGFQNMLERSVLNRLESVLQVGKRAVELHGGEIRKS